MKKGLLASILLTATHLSFGQIQIGGNQPIIEEKAQEKVVKKEKERDTTKYSAEIFIGASVMSTFRSLGENPNVLFGKELNERENETAVVKPAFQLGFRKNLNSFLKIEVSGSYYQGGLRYGGTVGDSSYNYSVNYNNFGIGLKLYYYHSFNKWDVIAGAGVMPNFRMKTKRVDTYIVDGRSSTEESKSKEGQNNIGINILVNAGLQYNFHPRVGFFGMVEYRTDLTNQFMKYEPFKQKNYGIGATFGIVFKIK